MASLHFPPLALFRQDGPVDMRRESLYAAEISRIAEAVALARDLINTPANDMGPEELARAAQQLSNRFGADFKTIVGDNLKDIVRATKTALSRADILLFSGGLGPTEDDLTREAVAQTLGLHLRRDPEIIEAIERRFTEHGWKMSPNNVKQADVISGATVLPNANGTAPGQWIGGRSDGKEKIVVLLPGPPHELKALFENAVLERLRAKVPNQFLAARVLKITGMGESACDARVAPIYKRFTDVDTTILAAPGEIQLHLRTKGKSEEAAENRLDELVALIEEELGDNVYSDNGDSLEQIVSYFVFESVEDAARGCARGFDRRLWRGQRACGTGSGRRYSQKVRNEFGIGCDWSCGADWWNRRKAGGLSISRARKREWNGSCKAKFSGRSRAHTLVRIAAGTGYGEKKVDVKQLSH